LGPTTHGREFFAALHQQAEVDCCRVIPPAENSPDVGRTHVDQEQATLMRRLARALIPKWLRELLLFFLFPKKSAYNLIQGELEAGEWDALVMRPEWDLAWVPKLKKKFPHLCIALEINAAGVDERFQNIPFIALWKRLEVRMMNSADLLFPVSQYLKEYLIDFGADAKRIHVNPNGVNLSRFDPEQFSAEDRKTVRAALNIPEKTLVFGYVGGMQTFRRIPDMVEGFSEFLEESRIDAWLIVVGDGKDMPQIQAVHARLPVEHRGRILFTGAKPYDSIPRIMAAFDVGIFPYSNPYGSPQKLFEYMAMGLPVIGPKVPVVEETFRHEQHILLTAQEGHSDLKKYLLYCAKNFHSLSAMAKEGRKHVIQNFTWDANAQRVAGRIQECLKSG
jgi:glycosyltransferase involved in cell wall biosynthesis